ncbi:MAG: 4Fe-4S dicluster domain-containing protein [bacterium]|nr:4Fe-4S dicluster domain-containing protein [bacterium]
MIRKNTAKSMLKKNKPIDIEILPDKCDLCGVCVAVCPPNVMNIVHKNISINYKGCTFCSLCIQICPLSAIIGHS